MLSFEVADVTGTNHLVVDDVQFGVPAGAVAQALASRMSLPMNVPWALRDDSNSALLDDDKPIGEQVNADSEVKLSLTPKAHLG